MEYKASLDRTSKFITIVVIIIFIKIGYRNVSTILYSFDDTRVILINSGWSLFISAALFICYILAPQSYSIDENDLTIKRLASNVKIKLSDIEEVRTIEEGNLIWMLRTFGSGGLFGYFGNHYAKGIGNLVLYATKRTNRIFVQTKKGKKIIITPDDLGLVDILKEKLTK